MVIKFLHPGTEASKKALIKGEIFPPNRSRHLRKYLQHNANYIEQVDDRPKKLKVQFWGEWEGPSEILEIYQKQIPSSLHRPCNPSEEHPIIINTDPLVFEKHWFYTNCQQFRKYGPTKMNDLEDGSLILFGSTSKKSFLLDIVLVTKQVDKIKITSNQSRQNLLDRFSEYPTLLEGSLKPLLGIKNSKATKTKLDAMQSRNAGCNPPICQKTGMFREYTIYRGITYAERNQFDGCFSFVPARPINCGPFNRVKIDRYSSGQTQGFCVIKDERKKVFNTIVKAVQTAKCGMAVGFHPLENVGLK